MLNFKSSRWVEVYVVTLHHSDLAYSLRAAIFLNFRSSFWPGLSSSTSTTARCSPWWLCSVFQALALRFWGFGFGFSLRNDVVFRFRIQVLGLGSRRRNVPPTSPPGITSPWLSRVKAKVKRFLTSYNWAGWCGNQDRAGGDLGGTDPVQRPGQQVSPAPFVS